MRTVETGHPYLALYRRYRPQRFSDLVGQDHVAVALRRATADGRVAHAYLFSGPRGTGKTSTARILAMALNCEAPQDGDPCGECSSCRAVRSGSSLDVAELDAASNRRLEDMRELLSHVALGTPGRRKVYIVDEVHQLTSDAASALLKTLEEPPSHVTFVLATTEPQAVPETIRSRTQHFNFNLIGNDMLTDLVAKVAGDANLELGPEALAVAVRQGAGSARDALSALDRIAAGGGGEVDGTEGTAPAIALASAIAERDQGAVLAAMASAVASGWEPRHLGRELIARLREAFLSLQAPSLVSMAADEAAALGRQMGLARLVATMEAVGTVLAKRNSPDPRASLEVVLLAAAAPPGGLSDLAERLEHLESRSAGMTALPAPLSPQPSVEGGPADGAAPVAVDPAPEDLVGRLARLAAPAPPPPLPRPPDLSLERKAPAATDDILRAVLEELTGIRERLDKTDERLRTLLCAAPRSPAVGAQAGAAHSTAPSPEPEQAGRASTALGAFFSRQRPGSGPAGTAVDLAAGHSSAGGPATMTVPAPSAPSLEQESPALAAGSAPGAQAAMPPAPLPSSEVAQFARLVESMHEHNTVSPEVVAEAEGILARSTTDDPAIAAERAAVVGRLAAESRRQLGEPSPQWPADDVARAVRALQEVFPKAKEEVPSVPCAGCGKRVAPAPDSASRGWATTCSQCFAERR